MLLSVVRSKVTRISLMLAATVGVVCIDVAFTAPPPPTAADIQHLRQQIAALEEKISQQAALIEMFKLHLDATRTESHPEGILRR